MWLCREASAPATCVAEYPIFECQHPKAASFGAKCSTCRALIQGNEVLMPVDQYLCGNHNRGELADNLSRALSRKDAGLPLFDPIVEPASVLSRRAFMRESKAASTRKAADAAVESLIAKGPIAVDTVCVFTCHAVVYDATKQMPYLCGGHIVQYASKRNVDPLMENADKRFCRKAHTAIKKQFYWMCRELDHDKIDKTDYKPWEHIEQAMPAPPSDDPAVIKARLDAAAKRDGPTERLAKFMAALKVEKKEKQAAVPMSVS